MSRLADRYSIEREIGSGGMARVFLSRDEVLDRPVAVKVLKEGFESPDIADRFRREGRMAARLSHPSIVQVYDAGEDDLDGKKVSYIVMEYLAGGDLKQLIDERGPVSGEELARLGVDVAAGLAHAHGRGVIHRDIKPHNILLGESGLPKLTDFGIARALDATPMTRTGHYLGTALYSSPEQLQGQEATPKSDVYSLGATLYQVATGEPPFAGSEIEVANQHVSKDPIPPRELGASVDEDMEALILACLSKNLDARPSAGELREKLARAGHLGMHTAPPAREPTRPTRPYPDATTRAQPPGPARQTSKRRLKEIVAVLAFLAVLALIGALVAPALLGGENRPQGNAPVQNDPDPNRPPPSNDAQNPQETTREQTVSQQQTTRPRSASRSTASSQPASQQATASPQPTPEPEPNNPGGGLTEQAAAGTVVEMYTSAADGDYDTSYSLLSSGYQQTTSSSTWAATFDTLQTIEFIQGPTAQISGGTATVTGTTIATHTDRTERNVGTWTLVDEDGEWKVDSISVQKA